MLRLGFEYLASMELTEHGRPIIEELRDRSGYSAHLIVRDQESLHVVGCYRIMRPEIAARRGAFYSDSEFDLNRLNHLRGRIAEVGRACIHPDFRSGSVIMLLWSGLAKVVMESGYEYAIGCASVSLADGHANAVAVYRETAAKCLAPPEYRVFPKNPYPLRELRAIESITPPRVPALLKGYMRLGAWIGGEPAWDPDFNTADLFVLLPVARINGSYARHFMGGDQAAACAGARAGAAGGHRAGTGSRARPGQLIPAASRELVAAVTGPGPTSPRD